LETIYFKKPIFHFKGILFVMLLCCSTIAFSQVVTTETDSTGYAKGKMQINNPTSILDAYTYDPATDRYVYTSTFEGFNINYPIILTPKQYQELVQREAMRNYFKEKSDAIDGKKDGTDKNKKNLLPRYYVNSGFFETLFGSNTIDVKPTGSVEMDLGVRYTKQDNPAFSPRNRAQTTFDFNQRISMSLMGKVGTRLSVNANYDTQSTFAFQNLIKLEYAPTEDDIIQKIEVGNVSMPLSNSLIRGAQSLFGVKAQLQFGKTTITGVFSEQKSKTKSVTAQGGGTIQNFELFALDYDNDRHFFLSQYFRNKYDQALKNYPFIDSRVQITRIEVWVTNKQNRVSTTSNNLRNIIAIQDLGESQYTGIADSKLVAINPQPANFFIYSPTNVPADFNGNVPPDNRNNKYDPGLINTTSNPNYPGLLNTNIRDIVTSSQGFNNTTPVSEGDDYSKLENARKLAPTEFNLNPQLGYISLQQRLSNDEVLSVAYQYTIGDNVYQVGEFGTDGVDATVVTGTGSSETVSTQSLILKMLKSNLTNVQKPVWNLMMKNIYQIPNAYQLQQEDFRFNILYTDPSPLNYITPAVVNNTPVDLPADVKETPLLKVFNVDRLNYTNDPQNGGDGFFDFLPGLTVDQQNGRIIFTTVEPFGSHLFEKLKSSPTSTENYDGDPTTTDYNANQAKYVFRNMYRNSQAGALQDAAKNKFQLKGRFKSMGGDGIPIGAYNVPKGSVVVTAGGRVLVEGIDYSVNYQAGRVQILDPSLQASNTPIKVSVENNSNFGQQTRRFMGFNIEHKFSDKFLIGATLVKMTERPFTSKSSYGQESVNNTMFGFNGNYATEVPFLTRLVNHLPNIDTDVPSNVSFRGEVAFLRPDTPKADRFKGESTVYVDDFEGSQTTIDMKAPLSWTLSSVPKWKAGAFYDDFGAEEITRKADYKRAKLSWYSIDPSIYVQTPGGISTEDLSLNNTRRIFSNELFPNTDILVGQSQVINTLDLSFYPNERGPYNYNEEALSPSGFIDPKKNFGGIMRAINSTNFEQSNVEYIQFWVLDPYYDPTHPAAEANQNNTGKLYFNLGEISEDVLKDERKQYENGLPSGPTSTTLTNTTVWGKVPSSQSLIYAFDADGANRTAQDIGYDGVDDEGERNLILNSPTEAAFANLSDPAGDNYQYFLNASGSVFDRYKNYNNTQGNSPINVSNNNRGSTTLPDVEDINRDNTMNTVNAYYEYGIDIKPNMQTGENFITDVKLTDNITLPNGNTNGKARWLQFKIPVTQPTSVVGSISDFRSIRFMRMFMTGFSEPITVRFGALDLVRGEWRRYDNSFQPLTDTNPADDGTNFDVLSVSIQENSQRSPIHYVTPPGVVREQTAAVSGQVIHLNEQSLSLRVSGSGLEPKDSRAVFKNVNVDMRQYNKLKMFLHAESLPLAASGTIPLHDDEMVAFIRFGNDFTNNFYQVEIPLKVTSEGVVDADKIWPEANEINLALSNLTAMKVKSFGVDQAGLPGEGIYYPDDDTSIQLPTDSRDGDDKLKLGIKGNPNFGLVRTLMVGVMNKTTSKIQGEVWFNELRLADMNNKGGMAAVLNMDANMADFATVSATTKKSTIGFGSIEQGPQDRSREENKQYNIVTNLSLGKLFPKKWGINLPFNYGIGEEIITPEYDPFNQDIRLEQLLANTASSSERSNLKNRAIDYTKRKSINFIGVKKERGAEQKPHIYDPENLSISYSYNQVQKHNYEIESYVDQQVNTTVDYTFAFKQTAMEPFKKSKYFKKSSYWKMLSDFNFNYVPSNISFSSNIIRQFNRQEFRQVVSGLPLDPLFRRNYMFNYQYGFNYPLTKSLKINYTASSHNIVRNYIDSQNNIDNTNTIWTDFWNMGEPNQHNQQIVLNYDLPLSKLPFLSFLKSSYTYTGDYSWQRASVALQQVPNENDPEHPFNLGNTIQNASSHKLNTTFSMESFYKYIGLGKKTIAPAKPIAMPKPGEKIANTKAIPAQSTNVFLEGLKGVITSVKNIQINYTQNEGTVLPGFLPGLGFFGSTKPSLGFVFGAQDDVRYEAAKRGWLTSYQNFNQNYTQVVTKTLDFTANMDLFPDFKIDLAANRTFAQNYSEQYDVSDDGFYNSRSPYTTGNFAISTVMLKSSFKKSDEKGSSAFDEFRNNRLTIANRLATLKGIDVTVPANLDADGFPLGYGKNSQAVLIPSLLAAYTGLYSNKMGESAKDISLEAFRNIPIPNWTVKYSGLMRYQFFKDTFKRFTIQHAYRASYTINSFRSNFEYDKDPGGKDTNGNFLNKMVIGNINLVEQFNPLIRFDFEMKNSFKFLAEMKKDRSLSMSFDNNLLTEVQGKEFIVGLGYRFKDVIFSSKLADNPTGIIKSDLNVKIDFSYRNNKTIVRNLDYNNNQLGGGQNIWSAKLTADYSLSKNLTAIFFYDHSFSKPVISTSFPLTNIRTGFTMRYNFGN
jgi:cell surface protein SprA